MCAFTKAVSSYQDKAFGSSMSEPAMVSAFKKKEDSALGTSKVNKNLKKAKSKINKNGGALRIGK